MTAAIAIIAGVTWAGVGFLVFLLWRIARFYEQSSSRRAYSYLFLPPLLLLPAGAAFYIFVGLDFVGGAPGDLLFLAGGTFLLVGTMLLGQIMAGGQ